MKANCLHCSHHREIVARGLCYVCYADSAIRQQYPVFRNGKEGYGAYGQNSHQQEKVPPLPPKPTTALPGTRIKLQVMQRRVEQGFQPHHPLDAQDSELSKGISTIESLFFDESDRELLLKEIDNGDSNSER